MTYQRVYVVDTVTKKQFEHQANKLLSDGWRVESTALWYDAEFDQPHYVAYLVKEVEE